jgi:hypothetical protein
MRPTQDFPGLASHSSFALLVRIFSITLFLYSEILVASLQWDFGRISAASANIDFIMGVINDVSSNSTSEYLLHKKIATVRMRKMISTEVSHVIQS